MSVMFCCAVSVAVSQGSSRDDVSPLHLSHTGNKLSSVPGNTFNFLTTKEAGKFSIWQAQNSTVWLPLQW